MLVYRSLALGLAGACLLLLASRPIVTVRVVGAPRARRAEPVAIIDVAPGLAPAQRAALVRLAPGEHVIAIDDRPGDDLAAGAAIALRDARPGFLDLQVASARGAHRLLVLFH
ncbi:MAG TPA: hypothetical protein VLX92_24665 [Kofleriaceae bacterium]|nr:hypothetical protein [Kofleriaceae bacterium]